MIKIVTLIDITKAIINQVTEGLKGSQFETVEFSSTDIEEEIIRPSFYIDYQENKTGRLNRHNKERTLKVDLYYFAKDLKDNQIELLEIQDFLESIFLEELKVSESFFIPIEEIDVDVRKENGFLIMNMDLYTIEEIEISDTAEIMDDLTINNKINGGI